MAGIIKPGDPAFNGASAAPVDPRPLVAVCVPCQDLVHHDFMLSLIGMLFVSQPFCRPALQTYQGAAISWSRNALVELSLKNKADWLLFVDSDMTFPNETLGHLLNRGRSVIGATYPRRRAPFDSLGRLKPHPGRDVSNGGVFEAEFIPGGMLLVKASVFRQIKKPWFEETYDYSQDPPFVTEDYGFCNKAKAAGVSIWIDIDLSQHIGHLSVQACRFPPLKTAPAGLYGMEAVDNA